VTDMSEKKHGLKMGSVTLKWVDPNSGKVEYVNFGLGDMQAQINGKRAVDKWVITEIETHGLIESS
jgi:hypothetical protein